MAQIEPPVDAEAGVEDDIHKPALAIGIDPGKAAERLRRPPVAVEDAEIAVLLGDQDAPVREEGHAPCLVERPADRHQAEGVLLRAVVARPGRFGGAGESRAEDERGDDRADRPATGSDAGQSATSISTVG